MTGSDKPENHPVIAAMIERLDNSCGKIFNKIKELDLEYKTIVIFFADNGGKHAYAAQTPFRAGKGWLYEGGTREPLIVKWKDIIKPKTTSGALVSSIDFYPTFLEIAGLNETNNKIDGKSFIPVLIDTTKVIHEKLFWHYPHYHSGSGMVPAGAVRSGKWKLIKWYENSLLTDKEPAFELFDLENDIAEKNNLTDSLN